MPFIQQDTTVGVCAEADLWMVARLMNKIGESKRFRPAEITSLATASKTNGPPREGLSDEQIMSGLQAMNLNPVCLYPANPGEAMDFIYSCIESGLPVIAGIPSHVIVVIGHYYSNPLNFLNGSSSMSSSINRFIAHDDASGPYQQLEVGEFIPDAADADADDPFMLLTLDKSPVDVCFASLPERVHVTWNDVNKAIDIWLSEIRQYTSAIMGIPEDKLWLDEELQSIITRVYLRRSSDYKRDILIGEQTERRHDSIVAQYLCMPMPKYVWVVELAQAADITNCETTDRMICGEIVIDSTGNRHVPEQTLLAFHLNGIMFTPVSPVSFGSIREPQLIVEESIRYKPLLRDKNQTF